jgi:hypothetical protein
LYKKFVQLFGAPVNFVTAPGWLMVLGWGLYLMLVIAFFKEPRRPSVLLPAISTVLSSEKNLANLEDGGSSLPTFETLTAPLLANNSTTSVVAAPQDIMVDEEEECGEGSNFDDDGAVETVTELLTELTLPIKILLWVYFMLKFASEILISESSVITSYYFDWTTTQVTNQRSSRQFYLFVLQCC